MSENENKPQSGLNPAQRQELAALCRQRSQTYAWLARLYKLEVDAELLQALKATDFPADTGDALVDSGYLKLATYLGSAGDGALQDLAIDYVRTFIGHGNTAYSAAYPYESVYTSERRLLMQEARDEILALYRAAGMRLSPSWKDPEDHIGLELEYMEITAQDAAAALEQDDQEQALLALDRSGQFLRRHLAGWAPMMTKDMRKFAQTGLYQGLADITEGYLRMDRAFLGQLVVDA
jgi:TorA maturation chaperone TorD